MVVEDLEYLLTYGTTEQRSQAIVKVARAKSIEAIPVLMRVLQDDPDPEIRALADKAVKYLIREYRSMDEDTIDHDVAMRINDAIIQYRTTQHHTQDDGADGDDAGMDSMDIRRQSSLATLLFGGLFLILGVAILVVLAQAEINNRNFAARATSAIGVVVNLRVVEGDEGDTYMPVIEFTAQDGEQYRIEASYSSYPPRFSIGDTVEVLYLPQSPHKGVLAVDTSVFTNPLLLAFGVMALGFCAISLYALMMWIRMGSNKQPKHQASGGDSLPKAL